MSVRAKLRPLARHLHLLVHLGRLVRNWPQVYVRHLRGRPLPPLRFRNGLVLAHGPYDNPLLMIREVFVRRCYELEAVPPDNAVMIDLGANIGAASLFWAARSDSLHIHAYEPNPGTFVSLQRSIQESGLNDRVQCFSEAVGREWGSLDLLVDIESNLSTAHRDGWRAGQGRRLAVPTVPFDEVWKRVSHRRVWLLKIDTEGGEVDILEGASTTALAAVDNVIVEYHNQIVSDASGRCRKVLERSGFAIRTLIHSRNEGILYATRR